MPMPSSVSSSSMGWSRKMRGSISPGLRTIGANSIWASMSRTMSIPGATSISSMPAPPAPKHAPLRHVQHRLPDLRRVRAVEGDLLDFADEFFQLAFGQYPELAVRDLDLESARRECPRENHAP